MPDQIPSAPSADGAQTLDRYRTMLREHDWSFEYSDDQRVWRLGRLAQEQLEFLQRELDPDFTIWNSIAPEGYRRKPPTLDPRAHFPLDQEPSA
jgi:hypothetical protein